MKIGVIVVLSKREKYIAIGSAVAVAVLVLDQVVFSPLYNQIQSIGSQRADVVTKIDDATNLFERKRKLAHVWDAMQQGGLKADESAAESQAFHAILDWVQISGVRLATLKPERPATQDAFQIMSFRVTVTGTMASISHLLWCVETAGIPVRVNEVQITPQPEGSDNLSAQLSVSTLCMVPDADKTAKADMASMQTVGGTP